MRRVHIAAAQYPIDLVDTFEAWAAKMTSWVADAAENGADVLVFPEYAAMELAGTDIAKAADLAESLDLVMSLGDAYDAHHRFLSERFGVIILAGSRPFRRHDGAIVNRAFLHLPDGRTHHQDKIVMTRFERERWGITGGDAINVIDTPIGRIGISICYDVEFPLIARAQAEAGAELILAPSATDTMQGYWRVRIGAQARALENQCFVVQAPTIGMADWLPSLDENFGAAGVYCPPDGMAPDDGVLAVGDGSSPVWTMATIDLDDVGRWRRDGTVLNHLHWPEQLAEVQVVTGEDDATVIPFPAPAADGREELIDDSAVEIIAAKGMK